METDISVVTKRLLLRRHEQKDFERYWAMLNDPIAKRFTGGVTRMSYDERLAMFVEDYSEPVSDGAMEFAVTELESGKYLGYCGSRASDELEYNEFFYGFCRDSWGRGYGFEAASAALEWLFSNFTLDRYAATVDAPNTASVRILEKLGFKRAPRKPQTDCEEPELYTYIVDRADACAMRSAE